MSNFAWHQRNKNPKKVFECLSLPGEWMWQRSLGIAALVLLFSTPFHVYSKTPETQVDYEPVKKDLTLFIQREMERTHVKGLSLALVDDKNLVWAKGFGWADVKKKISASGDTLYPIGGISQVFTAVEILKLCKKGKIRLDDPIRKSLPGFSIHNRFGITKPITVRSLLANHSGLPGFFIKGLWRDKPQNLEQLSGEIKNDYLYSPPQTFYRYSYTDYALLGRLVEIRTKKTFPKAIQDDLFQPLGMVSSFFMNDPEKESLLSQGYRNGKEIPAFHVRDIPAAGLVSSADDLARFVQSLFDPEQAPIFGGAKNIQRMFERQYGDLPLDFGFEVGMGWNLSYWDIPGSEKTAWKDGAYPPYYSQLVLLPGQKLAVIVLSNSEEFQNMAKDLSTRAIKEMLQAKYGIKEDLEKQKILMPKRVPVASETLDRYSGPYSAFGQITRITREGDKLSAEMAHLHLDLLPVGQDTFVPHLNFLLFFNMDFPQYPVVFSALSGKEVAVIGGLPFPVPLEKIHPAPIPDTWKAREGDYELEPEQGEGPGGIDGPIQFNKITLLERDGFLSVDMKITFKAFDVHNETYKVAILPLSEEDAVVPGLFYGDGGTLHAVDQEGQTRVYYSGYWFSKKQTASPLSNQTDRLSP